MKVLRALLWALVVAACCAILGGCGSSDGTSADDGSTEGGASAAATTDGGGYTLSYIQGVRNDETFIAEACGVKEQADALGATVNVQGPEKFDPSLQIPIVNSVMAQKPDALIITPDDAKALYLPLKKVADAGTKVILTDSGLDKQDEVAETLVTGDDELAGRLSADALAEAVGDEEGTVLVVGLQPGVTATDARTRGFLQQLEKYPNLKSVGEQYDMHDPAKAAAIVQASLAAHPDLVGIFGNNTQSTDGAATGLRNRGKTGEVKLVGQTSSSAVSLLEQGVASALVIGKAREVGKTAVQAAVDVLDGKTVKPLINTGYAIATKDTLDDPDVAPYTGKASC